MLLLIWCKPCYRDSHIWDISYYLHCPRRLCVNLHYLGENEVSNIRVYWFYFHKTVLNAAARVVSNAGKFDRGLTHVLHSELHWMFRSESSISSEWQFTGVSKARLPSTSWLLPPHIGRCQSVSDFDLPAATILSYHDIVAARSAVGRSPSPVRWPGMRCLTTSETRRSVPTISGRSWRRVCFGMHLDT